MSKTPLTAAADFIVLDASAGSGKTYSLVQHILLSALKTKGKSDTYKNILAITFTNNAADEMKARLLKALIEFSELARPEESSFFEPIWTQLGTDAQTLQQRALATARHMLHNYSALNVGTIDQFTHRLVRTFTRDLDLDENFEVRLDLEAMVAEALDTLYSELGEDPKVRDLLVALVRDRMARDKTHNPDRELKKEGKDAYSENVWREMRNLPAPERMLEILEEVKAELAQIAKKAAHFSTQMADLIQQNGWVSSDIAYYTQVEKILLKEWRSAHQNGISGGTNVWKANVRPAGDASFDALLEACKAFYDSYHTRWVLLSEAAAKLQNLAATKRLTDVMDRLQKEQNTMPLSAFNKLIYNELQKEPAAFIYARLGEKFWHFYIDEFQDTSELQFENLHPLIEHSLTKDDSPNSAFIVGDAKQSIYRWRGGRAEQFLSLVHGTHAINRFEGRAEGHELYARETIKLENNFRTHGAIVAFNNALFPELASGLTDELHRQAYSAEGVGQKPRVSAEEGEVRIDFLKDPEKEKLNAEEYRELACEKTVERIREIKASGYDYRHIALLVRSNKDGEKLAQHLISAGIPVLSADALKVSSSFESAVLLACAKLYLDPAQRQSRFDLAYALSKLGAAPPELEAFVFQQNTVVEGMTFLGSVFPKAAGLLLPQESLFGFGTQVFEAFGLLERPNVMVDACLDLLYTYQVRDGSFATLPQWWEEQAPKRNVPVPEDESAVKVMTVHKSKGLEFEHVMVPFGLDAKERTETFWTDVQVHEELARMPLPLKKESREIFPPDQLQQIDNERYFDWMNIIYVAYTRPVAGLHLFFNAAKTTDSLVNTLRQTFDIPEDALQWRTGRPVPHKEEADLSTGAPDIPPIGTFSPAHLRMARTAPEKWFDGAVDSRKWGTAMHRVLQSSKEQRTAALNRLYRTGQFPPDYHEKAEAVLAELTTHPKWKQALEDDIIILTERSVFTPEKTLRPDLMLVKDRTLDVIDYKTGQERDKDAHQMQAYRDALQPLFDTVETTLVYL